MHTKVPLYIYHPRFATVIKIFLSNYNKIANRFIYWLHPEKDALGLGYQLLKAKESIVLGGWFGTSSVTELPVKTSDLVYPALIQRCGKQQSPRRPIVGFC